MTKKKLLFLGTRIETLKILKLYFNVTSIVTTKNSFIKKNNFKCLLINKKNKDIIFNKLIGMEIDILVSAGFPFLIPIEVLKKFKLSINCHPGKLPKYKGYYSIDDAIKNKETNFYSTIHSLNEKFDSGKKIFEAKINGKGLTEEQLKKTIFSTLEPFALFNALKKIGVI